MRRASRSVSVALVLALSAVLLPAAVAGSDRGAFLDDDGHPHEASIEAIAYAGITQGCAPRMFCPEDSVTRGEMAAFLNRALDLPAAGGPSGFVDTAGVFAEDIERLAAAGITTGCTVDLFCTSRAVTRAEMAAFLARALGSDAGPLSGPPPDDGCCDEGRVGVLAHAQSWMDPYTSGGHWPFIEQHYDAMIVYEPYWDSRLGSFDDVFAYRDLYGIAVGSSRATDHPEWLLRDGGGANVYIPWGCSGGTCPQYAADLGHAGFRDHLVAHVQSLVDRGYGGIMLDDVNMAWRFGTSSGATAYPIDPRTGNVMALADWQRYVAEVLELIRAEFPGFQIMTNVIWYADSPTFDNVYVDRAIAAADYLMLERGATDGGLTGGTGIWSLRQFLSHVDRAHDLGTDVLFLDQGDPTVRDQMYNLAAALLVSEGNDFAGTERGEMIGPDSFWAGFDTHLGHALGDREVDGTVLRRSFTDGLVLVNEPGAATVTVPLAQPMLTVDGTVVTSVTLGGREAAILVHT